MTKEDLNHFITIVDDLSSAGKTIEYAKTRLKDEGLTDQESNFVIGTWTELYAKPN